MAAFFWLIMSIVSISLLLFIWGFAAHAVVIGANQDFRWYPCTYKMSKDKCVVKVKWWALSWKFGKVETFYRIEYDWFDKNGVSHTKFVKSLFARKEVMGLQKKNRLKAKEKVRELLKSRGRAQ